MSFYDDIIALISGNNKYTQKYTNILVYTCSFIGLNENIMQHDCRELWMLLKLVYDDVEGT